MMFQRLLIAGVSIAFLGGCNAASFSTSKASLLSKSSAFGEEYTGELNQPNAPGNGITQDANGTINQPANGGETTGQVRQPEDEPKDGVIEQPDGTSDEVDFLLMCSDRRSQDAANFKKAIAENLEVQLLLDSKVCSSDINVIKGFIEKKKFTVADAKAICPTLVPAAGKWSNVSLVVDGVPSNAIKGVITVLYALNKDTMPAEEAADELCDKRSSPLVIHINSDPTKPRPVSLTSQAKGILFDLLGAIFGHEKVRISWFSNRDYGMLALPNQSGRVDGIDELFGNATMGPDNRTSDNGYLALAKWDSNNDKLIDAKDPVYSQLRVWVDANKDGKSSAKELMSLEDARIAFIDLDYSNDYAETDKYGNKTMMKSVVGRTDGSLDLIFDLWFAYEFAGSK